MTEVFVKYVFCSYRGILIVSDVHGNKIDYLCGELTLEKHKEIKRLSRSDVEFDGLENYKRFVSEKEDEEKKHVKQKGGSQIIPPFGIPQGTAQAQVSQVSTFSVENTSKKVLPVVLFGAGDHSLSTNFGNTNGITIDKPQQYGQFLAQSMANPVIIKSIIIQNTDKTGGIILIKKRTATGATSSNKLNIGNLSPFGVQQNISQHQLNFTLDGWTEFNFDLAGESKLNIQLFH